MDFRDKRYISYGPFEIRSGRLYQGGTLVRCRRQISLGLEVLFRNCGDLVSYEVMKKQIWGNPYQEVASNAIDNLAYGMRRALGKYGEYLRTEKGRGLVLSALLRCIAIGDFKSNTINKPDEIAAGLRSLLVEQCNQIGMTVVNSGKRKRNSLAEAYVTHVVTGNLMYEGESALLLVTMKHAGESNSERTFSKEFAVRPTKLFSTLRNVATEIAEHIGSSFRPTERVPSVIPKESLTSEAEREYVRGKYHFDKLDIPKAHACFKRAVELGGSFALAYAALADTLLLLALAGVTRPQEASREAKKAALRALQIDSGLGEAHVPLAANKAYFEHDWKGSEIEVLTAIRLSPRYATAHHVYAMASLLPLGRFDQAHDEISMAAQIQPHSSFIVTCAGILCYFGHRYSEAVKYFDDALELEPQLVWLIGTEVGPFRPEGTLSWPSKVSKEQLNLLPNLDRKSSVL